MTTFKAIPVITPTPFKKILATGALLIAFSLAPLQSTFAQSSDGETFCGQYHTMNNDYEAHQWLFYEVALYTQGIYEDPFAYRHLGFNENELISLNYSIESTIYGQPVPGDPPVMILERLQHLVYLVTMFCDISPQWDFKDVYPVAVRDTRLFFERVPNHYE